MVRSRLEEEGVFRLSVAVAYDPVDPPARGGHPDHLELVVVVSRALSRGDG